MRRLFESSAGISGTISGPYRQTGNRAVIGLLGMLLAAPSGVFARTLYVSATSRNPQPPYSSLATAAQNIQDAVDAAQGGDMVLVSDGVYATGQRGVLGPPGSTTMTRVVIGQGITVKSVNGAAVTIIDGANTVRCVYVGNSALLSGFTLTRGFAQESGVTFGGGVWCDADGVVTNCSLTGNFALLGAGASGGTLYNCNLNENTADVRGGGAYESVLYGCRVTGNNAGRTGGGVEECTVYNSTFGGNLSYVAGGGASFSTLYNCTLSGNSSEDGGGVSVSTLYSCLLVNNVAYRNGGGADFTDLYNCTVVGNLGFGGGGGVWAGSLTNCIVFYNIDDRGPNNYDFEPTLNYCCTTPRPTSGVANIAQAPAFVDLAGGDYRLQITSPCINAGINQDWMVGATDLDGNPRISWGTVDMGAYEFLLPSPGPWKNHGRHVSAVAQVAQQFLSRGLITVTQMNAFVSAAAKSDIGK